MPEQATQPPTTPRSTTGVLVIDGYGIRVAVERRHLVIAHGTGRARTTDRLPKVGHGLRRLVILGHTGTISLEALRWLDRVGITLVNIDSDGTELARSSRPGLDDARLRRAQALAAGTPTGLAIVVKLLDAKLAGQATVATTQLDAPDTAQRINALRDQLAAADALEAARDYEAQAAYAYFAAWPAAVAIRWANRDRAAVPEHWTRFSARRSLLNPTSATRASDPVNALLNYLYALAETECRLACQTIGLDPGLGLLHTDAKARDSLALDLIEPVRPHVDAYLLELLEGHTFRRADFHETVDGTARVLPPLTHRLADTLPRWQATVAPWAETVAHAFADASPRPIRKATQLTSATRHRSAIAASADRRKPSSPSPTARTGSAPSRAGRLAPVCDDCGSPAGRQSRYCSECWPAHRSAGQRAGTIAAQAALSDAPARARRGAAVSAGKAAARDQQALALGWEPDAWHQSIAAKARTLTLTQIQNATGLSISQASRIKRGVQVPHPRHWAHLRAAAGRG